MKKEEIEIAVQVLEKAISSLKMAGRQVPGSEAHHICVAVASGQIVMARSLVGEVEEVAK